MEGLAGVDAEVGGLSPSNSPSNVKGQAKSRAKLLPRPSAVRDRDNPSLFDYIAADPALPIDRELRVAMARDLSRWTRKYIFPTFRLCCLLAIHLMLIIKRVLPFQLASERLLSWGSVWFGKHFVSAEAQRVILRHFVIESQLVNFIARNAGGGDVPECDLFPIRAEELGHVDGRNAVIRHDVNTFNLLLDLAEAPRADVWTRRELADLDFSDLELPKFDIHEPKFFALDLMTSLYATALWIAVCLDERTTERAINSFQLDESLMGILANLTGDPLFRSWVPCRFPTWLGSPTGDPPRDLHWHILVHEYAYFRLRQLRDGVLSQTRGT
ncbi:MAG: hypothetical protein R3B07_23570 [Polyangiaceae bacterium]